MRNLSLTNIKCFAWSHTDIKLWKQDSMDDILHYNSIVYNNKINR